MSTEKIKAKDMTDFDGPVDTGDPHGKRAADKRKVGDIQPDESVGKAGKKGAELPSTTTVGEEIEALFDGVEGLSEDFVSRASTIVEGALSEKIALIREDIEAEYNQRLDEAYETLAEDLETKLDEYLGLFIGEYLEENRVAIEKGFRTEIAEQVISNIVDIVESAGVNLPEDKIDIADALVAENEELENKYNKVLKENIDLRKTVQASAINEAFITHTSDLSDGAKDKLRRLTENMEFADVDQFIEKLEVLKESFTSKPEGASKQNLTEASETAPAEKTLDPRMAHYVSAARGSYFGSR